MKVLNYLFIAILLSPLTINAQNKESNSVSEQIKSEKTELLKEMKSKLVENRKELDSLSNRLNQLERNQYTEKFKTIDAKYERLESNFKILKNAQTDKSILNAQLAMTEFLKVQKDMKPTDLFLSVNSFNKKLNDISGLQNYNAFMDWKGHYDNWYRKKSKNDMMAELINNSINLISDKSKGIPVYGSLSQTVTSGIALIISKLGNKHKTLVDKTPEMLNLLNILSQFENEKSLIDNEWKLINSEMKNFELKYDELLNEMMAYYELDRIRYENEYVNSTVGSKNDKYKNYCRQVIREKLMLLDSVDDKWTGKVETYMAKVQSVRYVFGDLTLRMKKNLNAYEKLFIRYSKIQDSIASGEFSRNINDLLEEHKNLSLSFNQIIQPIQYIDETIVLFIDN